MSRKKNEPKAQRNALIEFFVSIWTGFKNFVTSIGTGIVSFFRGLWGKKPNTRPDVNIKAEQTPPAPPLKSTTVNVKEDISPSTPKPQDTSSSKISEMLAQIQITNELYDNPGGGDCLFYALALDLLYIVQNQKISTHPDLNKKLFNRWHELDPSITYEELTQFSYIKFQYKREEDIEPTPEARKIWDKLQFSLRNILAEGLIQSVRTHVENAKKSHNPDAALSKLDIYLNFKFLYTQPIENENQNLLANNPQVQAGLQKIRNRNFAPNSSELNAAMARSFIRLVEQKNSPIVECITQHALGAWGRGAWGRDEDVFLLTELFDLNIEIHELPRQYEAHLSLQEIEELKKEEEKIKKAFVPTIRPNRHTISLFNLGNNHWETVIPKTSIISSSSSLRG